MPVVLYVRAEEEKGSVMLWGSVEVVVDEVEGEF